MNGGQDADVVVVGAGLGGLAAANYLHRAGRSVRIVEAGDAVGGRVRTDVVAGFRLDRGFQVLLSSYPSARALLDYDALDLRAFEPGARVRTGGGWSTIADPWRRPGLALQTALSGVGSIGDKLRIARLRTAVRSGSPIERYDRPEVTTADYLRQNGFSEEVIAEFFRPFFAGIFLDPDLSASSRMFEFLYRMFSEGEAVIPAGGMQAIPEQLAGRLPAGSVELGRRVARVGEGVVELEGGRSLRAPAIVVAAGAGLPELLSGQAPRLWRAVSCLYFAAPAAPAGVGRFLVLNGEGRGPINNLAVPSNLSPALAPAGQALVSVTVLGADADAATLEPPVRAQLAEWFGAEAKGWRLLRMDRIHHALPGQSPPWYTRPDWPVRIRRGLYAAGDLLDTASIDGALASGKKAAEAVLSDF